MSTLPPGTILQLMYLKDCLRCLKPGRFIEIDPGTGEISKVLLQLGWTGISIDLESATIHQLAHRFQSEINAGKYCVNEGDFFEMPATEKLDLVISCMVMEHLEDKLEKKFMRKASFLLVPSGRITSFLPSSPTNWGIEDDIAGHYRRYTKERVYSLIDRNGWKICHIAGLTFPLSNMLLPISNFLVERAEKSKLSLSMVERTKASGKRQVRFKTHFPPVLRFLLNPFTPKPFFWL